MQQYYLLTGNVLPPLSAQPQLEDFLDDEQNLALQRGELTLIGTGLLITTYLTYKFTPYPLTKPKLCSKTKVHSWFLFKSVPSDGR